MPYDIKLDLNGDIRVSPKGDISLTDSVRQAILVRLRWIYNEWRLNPEFGFPWFEEVFVKNPNTLKIRSLIQKEIKTVEEVQDANVIKVVYDKAKREASFIYRATVDGETFEEEVKLYNELRS